MYSGSRYGGESNHTIGLGQTREQFLSQRLKICLRIKHYHGTVCKSHNRDGNVTNLFIARLSQPASLNCLA